VLAAPLVVKGRRAPTFAVVGAEPAMGTLEYIAGVGVVEFSD
jgi:hypothetical protein